MGELLPVGTISRRQKAASPMKISPKQQLQDTFDSIPHTHSYPTMKVTPSASDFAVVAAAAASAAVTAVLSANPQAMDSPYNSLSRVSSSSPPQYVSETAPKQRKQRRNSRKASEDDADAINFNSTKITKVDMETQTYATPASPAQQTVSDVEAQLLTLLLAEESKREEFAVKATLPSLRAKLLSEELKKRQAQESEVELAIDRATDIVLKLIDDATKGLAFVPTVKPEDLTDASTSITEKIAPSKAKTAPHSKKPNRTPNSPSSRSSYVPPKRPVSRKPELTKSESLRIPNNNKADSPTSPRRSRSPITSPTPDSARRDIPRKAAQNRTAPPSSNSKAQRRRKHESSILTSDELARAFASIDTSVDVKDGLGLDFLIFGTDAISSPRNSCFSPPTCSSPPADSLQISQIGGNLLPLPELTWDGPSLSDDFFGDIEVSKFDSLARPMLLESLEEEAEA